MARYSRHNRHRRHPPMTRSRARHLMSLMGLTSYEGRLSRLSDDYFRNRYVPKPVKVDKALEVKEIDFNIEANQLKHHTDCYDNEDLVVRRGWGFQITINFNRKIHKDEDWVTVSLQTGRKPMESKGSIIKFKLPAADGDHEEETKQTELYTWRLEKVLWFGDKVKFDLVPVDVVIGTYTLFIETGITGADKASRFEIEDGDIHIIFNPWWEEDEVYMAKSDERDEYVLNESGRIWVGSVDRNHGRSWNFGQFDKPCLEAAIYLLDRAELKEGARRSVISIVRCISAQANDSDDNGVLQGRWTSEFPKPCTLPWEWTGSVAILDQFMKTGQPVKYGQCWVFSGIVTTLLRALGIPTRSVTNFQSAHDSDGSTTIDSHYDSDGEPVSELDDSVWNFHVWNESWFSRRDLPAGYDGWQASDATPQEASDSVMRCGPAPLKAIKEGHVYLNYDIPFVLSEVNGDRIYWKVNKDQSMEVTNIDSHAVGKLISTKAVGSPFRNDITNLYKHSEGSANERRVMEFVHKFGSRKNLDIYSGKMKQVVEVYIDVADTKVGEDISINIKLKNISSQVRKVDGRISVTSCFYTGVPGTRIQGSKCQETLKPKSESTIKLKIPVTSYVSKLNFIASMVVYTCFKIEESGHQIAKKADFSLTLPTVDIKIPSKINKREKSEVKVSFTNPLPVNLTNCAFQLECAGTVIKSRLIIRDAIKPGETVTEETTIWPLRKGYRELDVTFSSKQLPCADGEASFTVI